MKTLYLTTDEQTAFKALPADLQEGWEVETETATDYESLRQIKMRYYLADFSHVPEVKAIADRIANNEPIGDLSLGNIPANIQKELYFTLGARGVKALIETLVHEIASDDDIEALSTLSIVRHKLLEINSTSTHK
ncbi:MAG: hypothetical protein JWM56_405 [Candidatus Peribacteria bacterium]|nr:hypothetical protein [Candidatus Peribacteria bacterium]